MPLLDHFHPPLSRSHPWRGFHGAWAAALAWLLNAGVLPPGYYAVPFLDRAGPIEIDIATLTDDPPGGPATGAWSPAEPAVAVAVELPATDDVWVEVHTDDGDPRLAAAVELVSPRNKDRPAARRAFTGKCAGYLRRRCGVVVVDVVTTRRADLHAELLAALDAPAGPSPQAGLSAVAYRMVDGDGETQLLAWPESLAVGQTLPTLPLWLAGGAAVPLDLEASYTTACADLLIRTAG